MANTFKRFTYNNVPTTLTPVYTVPAATKAVVIGGVVSNTASGVTVDTTVVVYDGTAEISLTGTDTPIPSGTALSFVDGKIVLHAGDAIRIKSSAANSLDTLVSVMEIT
jgi:hypothetical protein